jgi:hypothetical protein
VETVASVNGDGRVCHRAVTINAADWAETQQAAPAPNENVPEPT